MAFFNTLPGKILSSGAVVNFVLVAVGSLIGLLLKKGLPERINKTLMSGMALCVMYIGITGLFQEDTNIILIIISIALGGVLGEWIDLDRRVNQLGEKLEQRLGKKNGNVAQGFVNATLLFCVGAMVIVGSIESGIKGDNAILYSKSMIDGVVSVVMASTLGFGVIFSAFSVLILEGVFTLLAVAVSPLLTEYCVNQISVIGSMLIIAISLNMLGLTKIKVMNYVPALLFAVVICIFL